METKEFVEKCFANFKNIPEEFKNKLAEYLDKEWKKLEADYKQRIIEELLDGEKILIEKLSKENNMVAPKEELVEVLGNKIKWEFNLFPLFTPNVCLSEIALGIKNGEKHLIKYQYLEYAEHFWVLVSIVEGKLDVFHAKTMEKCIEHLNKRIDEQQYEDVIGGDVTSEFVNEYLYLKGEK